MSRKGTDRQSFKDFYPDKELVGYLIYQLERLGPNENVGIEIRLMKQKDFDALWRSEAVSGKDGIYAYFGNKGRPWGYSRKTGYIAVTYCFRDSEKDKEVVRKLETLGKQSALMLDARARGN